MARTGIKTIISGIAEARGQSNAPPTEEEMLCLYRSVSSGPVIKLNGRSFGDQRLEHFCRWFSNHTGRATVYKEIDFSDNELTSRGVALLINTLQECGIWVERMKLHKNKIDSGEALAALLHHQEGALKELHLSHNRLSTVEGLRIVMAALDAKDSSGAPSYPHSNRHVPLWLRLENNLMDNKDFQRRLDCEVDQRGKRLDKAICHIHHSGECKNSYCTKPHPVPQVHLTYVHNQAYSSAALQSGRAAAPVPVTAAKAAPSTPAQRVVRVTSPSPFAQASSSSGSAWAGPGQGAPQAAKPSMPTPPKADNGYPSLQLAAPKVGAPAAKAPQASPATGAGPSPETPPPSCAASEQQAWYTTAAHERNGLLQAAAPSEHIRQSFQSSSTAKPPPPPVPQQGAQSPFHATQKAPATPSKTPPSPSVGPAHAQNVKAPPSTLAPSLGAGPSPTLTHQDPPRPLPMSPEAAAATLHRAKSAEVAPQAPTALGPSRAKSDPQPPPAAPSKAGVPALSAVKAPPQGLQLPTKSQAPKKPPPPAPQSPPASKKAPPPTAQVTKEPKEATEMPPGEAPFQSKSSGPALLGAPRDILKPAHPVGASPKMTPPPTALSTEKATPLGSPVSVKKPSGAPPAEQHRPAGSPSSWLDAPLREREIVNHDPEDSPGQEHPQQLACPYSSSNATGVTSAEQDWLLPWLEELERDDPKVVDANVAVGMSVVLFRKGFVQAEGEAGPIDFREGSRWLQYYEDESMLRMKVAVINGETFGAFLSPENFDDSNGTVGWAPMANAIDVMQPTEEQKVGVFVTRDFSGEYENCLAVRRGQKLKCTEQPSGTYIWISDGHLSGYVPTENAVPLYRDERSGRLWVRPWRSKAAAKLLPVHQTLPWESPGGSMPTRGLFQ